MMVVKVHSPGHSTCPSVSENIWQENQINLPVLSREDYYTIPTLNKENILYKNGQYFVEDLIVGRKDFGRIYFSGLSNVTGLNLDQIVFINHKEVSLYPNESEKPAVGEELNRRAQIALDRVWPVDKLTGKPVSDPQLLREARFEEKLKKVNQKISSKFLEYVPQTGMWVFEVEHFSKYGLADSDDDDDEVLKDKDKLDGSKQKDPSLKVIAPPQKNIQKELQANLTTVAKDKALPLKKLPLLSSDDDEQMEELVDIVGEDSYHSEDHDWQMHEEDMATDFGLSAKKLFLMKSSFFADDDAKTDVDVELADLHNIQNQMYSTPAAFQQEFDATRPPKLTKSFQKYSFQFPVDEHEPEMYTIKENTFSESRLSKTFDKDHPFDDLYSHIFGLDQLRTSELAKKDGAIVPRVNYEDDEDVDSEYEQVTLDYPNHILPISKTTMGQVASKSVRDWSLFKGRSFRVGWSTGNSFVFLTTQNSAFGDLTSDIMNLDKYIGGRSEDDLSSCVVQRLQLCGGASKSLNKLSENIEPHLEIQLEHSTFVDGIVPGWKSNAGVAALPLHCSVAEAKSAMVGSMEEYHNQVWNLCMALWGDLPDIADDKSGHNVLMVRKEALSNWLQNTVEKVVAEEVEKTISISNKITDVSASIVWSLLTGKQIMEACKLSEETGDSFLTLLMTQLGTPAFVKHLLSEQVYLWNDIDATNYLEKSRLKIFLMLAGVPLFNSKSETINICEGLDWKRAFGIHLWYMISEAGSIKDAITHYNNAFLCPDVKDVYAKRPVPDYLDDDYFYEPEGKHPTYDICYHLLQLYCNRHYRMEQIFDPATYTTDPLDYQISWFVFEALNAIGYTHTSEHVEAQLHTFFANQLESCGLWHWAVFVLLHLKNPSRRKAAVMNTLEHYLQINGDDEYKEKEEFLKNKLRIPEEWIYEVKATRAMSERCYKTAVWYLNKTKEWSLAHSTLMQHLAANYLINENYNILYALLKPMVESGAYKLIPDWQNKGQIIWDYLEIVDKIGKLLTQKEKVDGYLLQDLQPDLINLCQRINLLAEATPSLRLCKYDIAKRIFDLVGSVVDLQKDDQMSCRILLYVSTKLPLPDDFACKERDYLLKNWASQ